MLYAVISDVHANLQALQSVLRFVRRKPIGAWLVLGDLVGYGANPNEVVRLIQRLRRKYVVRGNHDRVAAGLDTPELFNEIAAEAVLWTRKTLLPALRGYLRHLPAGPVPVNTTMVITHGAPIDEDMYILSDYDALLNFERTSARIVWFGHTHLPIIYIYTTDGQLTRVPIPPVRKIRIRLDPRYRYLINPGSVGQPRDRCPWLSFCLFRDTDWTVTFYRLPYDIYGAQRRIRRVGLPDFLAHRLMIGI